MCCSIVTCIAMAVNINAMTIFLKHALCMLHVCTYNIICMYVFVHVLYAVVTRPIVTCIAMAVNVNAMTIFFKHAVCMSHMCKYVCTCMYVFVHVLCAVVTCPIESTRAWTLYMHVTMQFYHGCCVGI